MWPSVSTALGILTGLVVFLAMAVIGVIAGNGANNPGIVLVSAAAGGTAESPAPAPNAPLAVLDLNGDGKLSLAEAAGNSDIVTRFERADRNKDGKLTPAEFERLAKLPPPKARGKPRLQVRRDADAALASTREAQ
jgi:hypothetical protein